jgi:hypothetical protein
MTDAATITAVREKTHGNWVDNAEMIRAIKNVIYAGMQQRHARGQDPLTADQMECLDMVAVKIGRILAGDPNEVDHWLDISGYAHLVAKHLNGGDA